MKLYKLIPVLFLAGYGMVANATDIEGNSLQAGLDSISENDGDIDVDNDQISPDEVWSLNASLASVSRLIFEIAGFENNTSFGIYDITNPGNTLEIFAGGDCGTFDSTCTAQGNLETTFATNGGVTFNNLGGGNSATFGSNLFGYYIDSTADANQGGGFWYSQAALNSDGLDHMVAFSGGTGVKLDITGGTNYLPLGGNEYLLAFEDLGGEFGMGSDRDFSDMVVLVESVFPVAEPGTLALLGLGLVGAGFARRRSLR